MRSDQKTIETHLLIQLTPHQKTWLQRSFFYLQGEDNYTWEPKYCYDTKTWQGLREYMGSLDTQHHKAIETIFQDFKFKKIYKEKKRGNV